jgi:creatinine amidohydrolase/Fe(II)-dependent formamide hydrolase-like protein
MSSFPDFLKAYDRLEVGPVKVEPQRITAPYTVVRGAAQEQAELIYRWEEPVFDPKDPADANLAAMIAAQVALNYGLFGDEIVFRGPFDEADRRFLASMAENTSREIWVNKLLAPNPFLVGEASKLEAVRLENYQRAALRFDEPAPPGAPAAAPSAGPEWPVERTRHAVLSSGGKDSLLSFALLREIGRETHPIFLNESGRHWYTALNAYRELAATVPQTARVWTNSDRLFTWWLRRLPFVRPDFDRIRADIYPVRLWTVAVFLFGALPLLRKRKIGRLVIGDEYDTSVRSTTHGITHYDGLYDQSRWFDNALTRYFGRKRWGVSQFSILRPLSEFLIEKILAERYPEVLRLQMSCHMTHVDGDRVRPCGACEKCRRIVAMLAAIHADPGMLGYTTEQIDRCLKALETQPVKQEAAGAEHVYALLVDRGRVPPKAKMRRHPEIEKIRFDAERSPFDAIPVDLRRPLLRIFAAHSQGLVERQGRMWLDLDSADTRFDLPYSLERAGAAADERAAPTPGKRPWILGELSWPEAERRFREVDLALLPVGALEQHGAHSPLDTDSHDALYLALRVAERCSDPKPLVLPLVPYGVSYHHDDFPGTLSVSNEALGRFVYEIGMSAARNGIVKLVIINGHGGNAPTLQLAAQMINRDAHIFACVDTGETSDADVAKIAETPNDVHAGEIETSTTLAVRPHLVDMRKAKKFVPQFSSDYLDFSGHHSVEWYARTQRISPHGVLGDPTKATAEKGERIWEAMIRNLVEMVEHLKRLSLDQIHERRY